MEIKLYSCMWFLIIGVLDVCASSQESQGASWKSFETNFMKVYGRIKRDLPKDDSDEEYEDDNENVPNNEQFYRQNGIDGVINRVQNGIGMNNGIDVINNYVNNGERNGIDGAIDGVQNRIGMQNGVDMINNYVNNGEHNDINGAINGVQNGINGAANGYNYMNINGERNRLYRPNNRLDPIGPRPNRNNGIHLAVFNPVYDGGYNEINNGGQNYIPNVVQNGMHNGVQNGMHNGVQNGMHNGVQNGMHNGVQNGVNNEARPNIAGHIQDVGQLIEQVDQDLQRDHANVEERRQMMINIQNLLNELARLRRRFENV